VEVKEENLLKVLLSLGFTQLDAETYLFLEKNGLTKAKDVTTKLRVSKQRLYPTIKNLQRKGVVNATLERPARFSAVPFDKCLDLLAKAKIEEAHRVQQNKAELLSDWQSVSGIEKRSSPDKFTVIEGRDYIYSKIQQMMQETGRMMRLVTTAPSLARAEVFGLFDAAFSHLSGSKIQFRFLAELNEHNVETMRAFLRRKPEAIALEGRTPNLGLKLCTRMVIRDEEEMVFFIDSGKDDFATEQDNLCLWTNCSSLVQSFSTMFEELWRNSANMETRLLEIESGKSRLETSFNQDFSAIETKRVDSILSAEREVIMIASPHTLLHFLEKESFQQSWSERNVAVKMMVPVTTENFETVKQLSKFIQVRHVAPSYMETTVVDGRHLFQFRRAYPNGKSPPNEPSICGSYVTDSPEEVRRMVNAMNDIWNNAQQPSSITVESIVGSYGLMPPSLSTNHWKATQGVAVIEESLGNIAEKDVLDKTIWTTQFSKSENEMYATGAVALIHPPKTFNLPDMLIRINHIDKRSSLGAEDFMAVYLWLETPNGYAYVPAASIGDNTVAIIRRRDAEKDNLSKEYIQLVEKDKIQIRVYGNSLFCGWTVPIPLYPTYVLPPACLFVEGYGKVKTRAFSIILPSEFRYDIEYNYFDAFVNFMHPTSKYSGPGIDGLFARDLIVTTTPPKKETGQSS
jgi:sugar-specific transcriptional regulator TrmB